MGVSNLSLVTENYTTPSNAGGVLIHENLDQYYPSSGGRDIRFIWSTQYGLEAQEYWNFSIQVWVWGKTTNGVAWWDKYDLGTFTEKILADFCNPTQPEEGGLWWWSHRLDIGGIDDYINGGNVMWRYDKRVCDQIQLKVSVWSDFVEGSGAAQFAPSSETVTLDTFIGYCPVNEITDVIMYPGRMRILYDTTWKRPDDRFTFEFKDRDESGNLIEGGPSTGYLFSGNPQPLFDHSVYGSITAPGVIDVQVSDMLANPLSFDHLYLNVRWNASYRPIGAEFCRDYGNFEVRNATVCDGVTLTLKENDEKIVIGTSAAAEPTTETPADYAEVGMIGYTDTVLVEVGQDAVFEYAPFGTTVNFSGVGYTDEGASSQDVDILSVDTKAYPHAVLNGIDMGDVLEIEWIPSGSGKEIQLTGERNYDTVKLAGHQRMTAGFGDGGTKQVKLSATIIGNDARDWEDFIDFNGAFYVRFPDGRRYKLVGNVKLSKVTDKVLAGEIWTAEISGNEVE